MAIITEKLPGNALDQTLRDFCKWLKITTHRQALILIDEKNNIHILLGDYSGMARTDDVKVADN